MDQDLQVEAVFAATSAVVVTFAGAGSGLVSATVDGADLAGKADELSCRTSCTKVVPRGTRLALHATPDAESLFIGWRHAGSAAGDVLQEPVEIRCAREQCGQLANVTNEFGMIACHRDSVES